MKTKPLLIYTTLAFFGISAIGLWKSSWFKSSRDDELQKKYSMCTTFSISQDNKAPSIGGACEISEEDYSILKPIKSNPNLEARVSNETSTSIPVDYSKIYKGSRYDISLLGIQAAKYFGVDPVLVTSIMDIESDFVKENISNKGACGPMQVMLGTARDFYPGITKERLCNDYGLNIAIGVLYLKTLLEDPLVGGSYKLAAAAYNGGLGAVKFSKATECKGLRKYQCEKNNGYQETRDFVEGSQRCVYKNGNKHNDTDKCVWRVYKGVWTRYLELNPNY